MKNKTWIVVANSSLAKIFHAEKVGVLTQVECIDHPEGRLKNSDMVSDKPGCTHERGLPGRSAIEVQTSPKRHEAELFAKRISEYLEASREQGLFARLFVAASPTFLGLLRQAMSPGTSQLIAGEVDKDVTHMKPKEICEVLPFAL